MQTVILVLPIAFVLGFAGIVVPASVLADEEVVTDRTINELSEEEQVLLAEISQQLGRVEQELLRLSLVLAKRALEEKTLALEQQLQARLVAGASGVAADEGLAAVEESTQSVATSETLAGEELEEESGVAAVTIEDEEEAVGEEENEDERGFLAAFGPFGNLGTPELAALGILAFLVIFILIRRVRSRKEAPSGFARGSTPATPQISPLPTSVQQPPSPQGMLQEGKEDLKERVAWE